MIYLAAELESMLALRVCTRSLCLCLSLPLCLCPSLSLDFSLPPSLSLSIAHPVLQNPTHSLSHTLFRAQWHLTAEQERQHAVPVLAVRVRARLSNVVFQKSNPHKSVNLSFTITNIENKLTDLWEI